MSQLACMLNNMQNTVTDLKGQCKKVAHAESCCPNLFLLVRRYAGTQVRRVKLVFGQCEKEHFGCYWLFVCEE